MIDLPLGRVVPSATIQLEIWDPSPFPDGRIYQVRHHIPVDLILENNTQNYTTLTAELGELVWQLRNTYKEHHENAG